MKSSTSSSWQCYSVLEPLLVLKDSFHQCYGSVQIIMRIQIHVRTDYDKKLISTISYPIPLPIIIIYRLFFVNRDTVHLEKTKNL